MATEIERKWIIKFLGSNIANHLTRHKLSIYSISQYYTKINFSDEIRFRKVENLITKTEKYYKTVKVGNGLSRREFEEEIKKEDYISNMMNTVSEFIHKCRRVSNHYGYKFEFDTYNMDDELPTILEVEFESIEESEKFGIPEIYFDFITESKEVTGDERYKNKTISLHGIPKNK